MFNLKSAALCFIVIASASGVLGCPKGAPVAAFTASTLGGPAPLTVQFTNRSSISGAKEIAYAWDFGDGDTSAAASPQHTYNAVGEYTVSLTVISEAGASSAGETITVVAGSSGGEGEGEGEVANAIMFVTQTPFGHDFANIMSTFGTHKGNTNSASRGGDLYIRYADGTLRNLTADAGFGVEAGEEITVRDPQPHWSGTKALFSMVVGGTTQNDYDPVYFQIYEVSGIGEGEAVNIEKLPQPEDYNNVTPIYASDGRILFTSDRPHNGDRRLYPPRDEYESTEIVSGLWSMNPDGTNLRILDHSPSGDFSPFIDSFGRVIFTRWDHLQRDQQADADIRRIVQGQETTYNSMTFESEDSDVAFELHPSDEVFPEQRGLHGPGNPATADPIWDALAPTETTHTFNHFFPWMMSQDGTGQEILNHLGRHELAGYIAPARTYLDYAGNEDRLDIFLQICESPIEPGTYYGINCPEFGTHASGQIVSLVAPPGMNADGIRPRYHTHPETSGFVDDGEPVPPEHVGLFRDPLVLSDGTVWASHSNTARNVREVVDNPPAPAVYMHGSRYNFEIRQLVEADGGYLAPGMRLVEPIHKSISYFDNSIYREVAYEGPMWQLQAVEVYTRPVPPDDPIEELPAIEYAVIEEALGSGGIDELTTYLAANELALVVSRDVTMRADTQQDFNLKVAWSEHASVEEGETPKEIGYLQFFEGKLIRGYDREGRRVLARPMDTVINPTDPGAPEASVRIGDDGSMAAFVPAGRALSWQTTEPDGTPAVRERYWLTFAPGEIRVCGNCHGINREDVFGRPGPQNPPQALRGLLQWWRDGAAR